MIEVELPDGSIAEFPDGTADEVITGVLAKEYAPQQPEGEVSKDLRANLSAMTQNPAKALYDQKPAWQKPIIAAQDIGNIMGDAVTFGYGDKIAAAGRSQFTGKPYEEELASMRQGTQNARDRAGSAGVAADVVGSVAVPLGAASKGATLTGRLGSSAMTGAKGVGLRAGLLGAEGAGYGALSASGHDTSLAEGAALGTLGGAAGSLVGDSASALLRGNSRVPDLKKLKDAEKAAYDAADKAGIIINPQGLQKVKADVQAKLTDFGYDPALQPRIAPVLSRLDELSQGNITLKGLHTLRKVANNARISEDASEKAAGGMVVDSIDNFLDNMSPADVLTGDRLTGPKALRDAIKLGARVRKNENFIFQIEKAKNRAGSTGSGGNVENAMRQNVRKVLEKGRGLTADEKAAMQELVRGTAGQNVLRWAGKFAPTGIVSGGIGTTLGASGGAMVGGPVGAGIGVWALPALGQVAKTLSDRNVAKGVEAIDELIRSGGNSEALRNANATLGKLSKEQRDLIAKIVMGSAIGAQQEP